MSKKLLFETLQWLESLKVDTEDKLRVTAQSKLFFERDDFEDIEERYPDIREYRRQFTRRAFAKWKKWLQHKKSSQRRNSIFLNNHATRKPSNVMNARVIMHISRNSWHTFYNTLQGFRCLKKFVERNKYMRQQFSLHKALQCSILHVGPKSRKWFAYNRISCFEMLTKHHRVSMMVRFWKIWSRMQRNRKIAVIRTWKMNFSKCVKIHNMICKLDKIQGLLFYLRWKRFTCWWSVKNFRNRYCLQKAMAIWNRRVVIIRQWKPGVMMNSALSFHISTALRKINHYAHQRNVMKTFFNSSVALHRFSALRRVFQRLNSSVCSRLHMAFLSKRSHENRVHYSFRKCLIRWRKSVCMKIRNNRSVVFAHRKLLRIAMLSWFYKSCVPPVERQTFYNFRNNYIAKCRSEEILMDKDVLCKILMLQALERCRQLQIFNRVENDAESAEFSGVCRSQIVMAAKFLLRSTPVFSTTSSGVINFSRLNIRSFLVRRYEKLADQYYKARNFRAIVRRLQLFLHQSSVGCQRRLFMIVFKRKCFSVWKYRAKYSYQPQREAFDKSSRYHFNWALQKFLYSWKAHIRKIRDQRQVLNRLVRFHRLSYNFQKIWHDRYHIGIIWLQRKVFYDRARHHFRWNKQQRFLWFWQQWTKTSRKRRIVLQAFRKLYPSSTKTRRLQRNIFNAWQSEYLPYAKAVGCKLQKKILDRKSHQLKKYFSFWIDCFEEMQGKRIECRRAIRIWMVYALCRCKLRRCALSKWSITSSESPQLKVSLKYLHFPGFYLAAVYSINLNRPSSVATTKITTSSPDNIDILGQGRQRSKYKSLYCQRHYFMKWNLWLKTMKYRYCQYLQVGFRVINQLKQIQSVDERLSRLLDLKNQHRGFCAWQQVQTLRLQRDRSFLVQKLGRKFFIQWLKQYNRRVMQYLLRLSNNQKDGFFNDKIDSAKGKKRNKHLIGNLDYLEMATELKRSGALLKNENSIHQKSDSTRVKSAHSVNRPILNDISNEFDVMNFRKGYFLSTESVTKVRPDAVFDDKHSEKSSICSGDVSQFSEMTDDSLDQYHRGENTNSPSSEGKNFLYPSSKGKSAEKKNSERKSCFTSVENSLFSARIYKSTFSSKIKGKNPEKYDNDMSDRSLNISLHTSKMQMDDKEKRSRSGGYLELFEDQRSRSFYK